MGETYNTPGQAGENTAASPPPPPGVAAGVNNRSNHDWGVVDTRANADSSHAASPPGGAVLSIARLAAPSRVMPMR